MVERRPVANTVDRGLRLIEPGPNRLATDHVVERGAQAAAGSERGATVVEACRVIDVETVKSIWLTTQHQRGARAGNKPTRRFAGFDQIVGQEGLAGGETQPDDIKLYEVS